MIIFSSTFPPIFHASSGYPAKYQGKQVSQKEIHQSSATPCYEAIGVIELKSTTTKDLEAIRLQAISNQPGNKFHQNHHFHVINAGAEM